MNKIQLTLGTFLASISTAAWSDISWTEMPVLTDLDANSVKMAASHHEQQRVAFNQNLIGQSYQAKTNTGYVAESKQYWLDTTGSHLAQGIDLPITSSTVIIRLNPLENNKSMALAAENIELTMGDQAVTLETFANDQQMKAAGMPVAAGTVSMKVAAQPGVLQLKANGISTSDAALVVHVFEPQSPFQLSLHSEKQVYSSDANTTFKVSLEKNNLISTSELLINGYITAPNGEKIQDLKFTAANDGSYQAMVKDLPARSLYDGLWEMHAITETEVGGLKVMRDASTAFAISVASARFNQAIDFTEDGIELGVDVAASGRYEIKGTLLGQDAQGNQQPIALLMTADWLGKGNQTLAFDWPSDLVESAGLSAPFVVVDLELKNQSLMAPVQHVAGGFKITSVPQAVQDFR